MMKKIHLAFLAVSIPIFAQAQFTEGDWLLGGSLLLSNTTSNSSGTGYDDKGPSSSTIYAGPAVGYFIGDKWMIGLRAAFNNSITTIYHPDDSALDMHFTRSSLGGGPVARYYPFQSQYVDLWLGAGVYVGFGKNTDESIVFDDNGVGSINEQTDNLINYSLGIGPGASIIFNDHWRLELACGSLGFSGYQTKDKTTDAVFTQQSISLSLGSIGFGIAYKF